MTAKLSPRPKWELADVVKRFLPIYRLIKKVPASQLKILGHIVTCRTAALGGHLEKCDSCEHERPAYNSCRDRHCPKCQTMTKEKWLEARKAELLPVRYFHKVFTLPHLLNGLILCNKKVMIGILFKAVSKTLLQFGMDPRSKLKGKIGFTLVLHTWDQKLRDHFHIHCVIPAGGLSEEGKWIHAKHLDYLFSVRALSVVFRGKYLDLLTKAYEDDELIFPGKQQALQDPICFRNLLDCLRDKNWVVFSKAPFQGPEKVINYLGRYTHRVAISNNRIVGVNDTNVSFTYRDRKTEKTRVETVAGTEFLRRFLLHSLPKGLQRIRHY